MKNKILKSFFYCYNSKIKIAPIAVKYRKQPESPLHIEVLTPIEENEEYEDDEDNQPITMGKLPCK